MRGNGIRHIRTAPYHPSSNGLAERFVQSFKQALKASKNDGRSLNHSLSIFLLTYRSSPHATTGVPPCTLFLKRNLRTRFDLLNPSCSQRVLDKQSMQKSQHDRHAKDREFIVGERVMVRNLRPGPKWIVGIVCNPFCTGAPRHTHNSLLFSDFGHMYVFCMYRFMYSVCTQS